MLSCRLSLTADTPADRKHCACTLTGTIPITLYRVNDNSTRIHIMSLSAADAFSLLLIPVTQSCSTDAMTRNREVGFNLTFSFEKGYNLL